MGGGSSSYGKIVPDTMEMDVAALLRIRKHWSWRLEDEIGWQDLKPSSDLREMPTLKPPEYGFMPSRVEDTRDPGMRAMWERDGEVEQEPLD